MNVFGVNMKPANELREDMSDQHIFVVGDTNGNVVLLKQALALIEAYPLAANDKIVLLGNYIGDSGSSREVINFLKVYKAQRMQQLIMLRGSNEHKFICMKDKFLKSPVGLAVMNSYRDNLDIAASYNKPIEMDKVEEDIKWLAKQPHFYLSKKFCFVHSGLEPNKPLEKQETHTSLFIQRPFYRSSRFWSKKNEDNTRSDVIVVHTNSTTQKGEVDVKPNRIDLGAAITADTLGKQTPIVVLIDNKPMEGKPETLTAFATENKKTDDDNRGQPGSQD